MPVPGTHGRRSGAPSTVTARAVNAPAALGDDLYVVIPSYGPQRSLVVGWAYTTPLPQPGDQCLVSYDESGNPWVVAWR